MPTTQVHICSSALKFNTSVQSSILPPLLKWIGEKCDVYHKNKKINKYIEMKSDAEAPGYNPVCVFAL